MALPSAALLDLIDTAIVALLTGQHSSYSIGARSVTRIDLPALMEERRILQAEVARNSGSTIRLAKFIRTSR